MDTPVAGCDNPVVRNGLALQQGICQRASAVEDAYAASGPPKPAQDGEAAVLPSSLPEKTPGERNSREQRALLAVVIPPLPAKTNVKKRHISESAADSPRIEEENSDLPAVNVR